MDTLTDVAKLQKAAYLKEKGNETFKKGLYAKAVDFYTDAIQLDPKQPTVLCNRAMAYLKQQRHIEAIHDCNKCLALDATYCKAYYRRALAFEWLGDIGCAVADLRKIIEIEPKNTEAKKKLDQLLSKDLLLDQSSFTVLDENRNSRTICDTDKLANGVHATTEPLNLKKIDVKEVVSLPSDSHKYCSCTKDRNEKMPSEFEKVLTISQQNDAKHIGDTVDKTKLCETLKTEETKDETFLLQPPQTSFQLLQDWKRIRTNKRTLATYFKAIPPKDYSRIFGESLDADIISDIVGCIEILSNDKTIDISEITANLPRIRRFETVMLFLKPDVKQNLKKYLNSSTVNK